MKFKKRFPGGTVVKSLPASAGGLDSIPGAGRPPGSRRWQSTLVILAWEIPRTAELSTGSQESDRTEQLDSNHVTEDMRWALQVTPHSVTGQVGDPTLSDPTLGNPTLGDGSGR